MSEYDVRTTLLAAGWKQGACISSEEALREIPDIHEYHKKILETTDGCLLIITLYDCAIINDSFEKEPFLPYVLALPVDRVDPSFAMTRDIRKLHLEIDIGQEQKPYEINAGSIGVFQRESLLKMRPKLDTLLPAKSFRISFRWLAKRTNQPVYPDLFNERLSSRRKLIDKLFNKYKNSPITGFYIRLNPNSENVEKYYHVALYITVEDSSARAFKPKENEVIMDVASIFGEEIGIVLDDKGEKVVVLSEKQVTLDMLRDYMQWSPEYHSFKSKPEGIHPVNVHG